MRIGLKGCLALWGMVQGLPSIQAAEVRIVEIRSERMERKIPATLILPESYGQNSQRYPVLYLLHGAGGDHKSWTRQTEIAQLADRYDMMVLCPNGGATSWYFDSPIDPKSQFETFITKDCVDFVDEQYRTKPHRDSRALCGLSMGGHGAMYLGIRHLDTFSVSIVLSGGVDIRPFPNNWNIKKRLGDISTHRESWEQHTVINLAKQLEDGELAISIDCGTGDFFIEVNRSLHQQLVEDGISHAYVEHPGVHDWAYWQNAIKRQLPFADRHFRKAALLENRIVPDSR